MPDHFEHENHDPFLNVTLQGLLGLAPLAIMLSHWSEGLFNRLVPQQQISVDIFFTIEGLLTAALLTRRRADVAWRSLVTERLVKIYPLFLFGTLFGLALFLLNELSDVSGLELTRTADLTIPDMGVALALNLTLLPNLPHDGAVFPFDPPTWAIVMEIYAFAVVCVAWRWITAVRLMAFTAVAAIAFAAAFIAAHDVNLGFRQLHYWGGFARCFYGFAAGMVIYHVIRHTRWRIAGIHPLLIWGAFVILLFAGVPRHHAVHIGLPCALIAVPLTVWVAATARNPAWLQPIASQGARLCCALYVVHFPMLMLCSSVANYLHLPVEWLATPWYFLVCLALVIGTSHVVTMLAERLVRRSAGRLGIRQPA